MDFDHRDPNEKKYTVARLIGSNYSLRVVERELSKCDVVCANCHRERTHGLAIEGSSSGKTTGSEPVNLGSNPSPSTILAAGPIPAA